MEFKAKEPAHGGLPLWARPAKTLFLAMRLLWQTARELESTNWMPVQEPLRLFKYEMRGIKAEGGPFHKTLIAGQAWKVPGVGIL